MHTKLDDIYQSSLVQESKHDNSLPQTRGSKIIFYESMRVCHLELVQQQAKSKIAIEKIMHCFCVSNTTHCKYNATSTIEKMHDKSTADAPENCKNIN